MSATDPLRLALQTTLGAAYTLERELGGGGMSRVFVAREESLGRDVVVKVLAPELAAALSVERFTREIRLAAGLQEPHIVPVLAAAVTAEGLPYYTMPFVRGRSLRDRLNDGAVPAAEAMEVLRDVAKALAYAHRQGVVHRDIKPENVLLHEGTAVVTDFGIAKALSAARTHADGGPASGTLTQVGTSLGTPAYMAPEQAAGDAVDARADVYAWGLMAYELLAGRHPFAGKRSAQQLIAAQIAEAPASLGNAEPGVPPALAALVMHCLAKDPAGRPADGGALLAALDAALSTGGAPTSPSTVAELPSRRRGAAIIALSVVAFALLGGGAWAWRAHVTSAAAALDAPPLVAVLPFETAQSEAGVVPDSAFADGLGDAITGKLARLQGLRVIDRTSVRSVEGAAAHPQAAGRSLGADYVLRATLRWARGADGQQRVQVSPVLVRVSDGGVRWAGDPTVVTPSDPFAAQGTLATAVAEALDVTLAPTERAGLAHPATTDTAAFAAVERGRRLAARSSSQLPELEQALREFERAYRRDPQYADAWGSAANVLEWMAKFGAPPALLDSAAVLARRALAIDPAQPDAVAALVAAENDRGFPAEGLQTAERAARAFPSSVSLQLLLAESRTEAGDSAGAEAAAARALALAPRSTGVVLSGLYTMVAFRRYDEARDLLARARALDPDALGVQYAAVRLARAVGDTVGLSAALRALRGRGAGRGIQMLYFIRAGDAGLQQELAQSSLARFGATTPDDSNAYYWQKAQLFMARGEVAKARALADSGSRLAASLVDRYRSNAHIATSWLRQVALYAALRGDRPTAVAALGQAAVDPSLQGRPGGVWNGWHTCQSAEVYGLLGDIETMLPLLRRCFTMPNGYAPIQLSDPAFARHAADPRVRAFAEELAAAAQRARTAPARAAR